MGSRVIYSHDNLDITVKEILDIAKEKIEEIVKGMSCPEHDSEAVIKIDLSEDLKLKINIEGCCDDFEAKLYEKLEG
ncbi:MAG: hypothetical protein FWH53_00720 [Leptospirales bacterium]|nr:hypothetical protein [Leptospirales bacterium]